MIIYLMRHGTTPWNSQFRIQGTSDIPLDSPGRAIAAASGKSLSDEGVRFQRVFSSPLIRALPTAKLVAPYAKICTDQRLTELSFGDFEGRSVPDMTADPGCAFRHFKTDPNRYNEEILKLREQYPEKGYESLTELLMRTGSFVRDVLDPLALSCSDDTRILIAGHGALNKGLMMALSEKKDLRSFWGKGLQPNCGINRIVSHTDLSGNVLYDVNENSEIYYDPKAFGDVKNLL